MNVIFVQVVFKRKFQRKSAIFEMVQFVEYPICIVQLFNNFVI